MINSGGLGIDSPFPSISSPPRFHPDSRINCFESLSSWQLLSDVLISCLDGFATPRTPSFTLRSQLSSQTSPKVVCSPKLKLLLKYFPLLGNKLLFKAHSLITKRATDLHFLLYDIWANHLCAALTITSDRAAYWRKGLILTNDFRRFIPQLLGSRLVGRTPWWQQYVEEDNLHCLVNQKE